MMTGQQVNMSHESPRTDLANVEDNAAVTQAFDAETGRGVGLGRNEVQNVSDRQQSGELSSNRVQGPAANHSGVDRLSFAAYHSRQSRDYMPFGTRGTEAIHLRGGAGGTRDRLRTVRNNAINWVRRHVPGRDRGIETHAVASETPGTVEHLPEHGSSGAEAPAAPSNTPRNAQVIPDQTEADDLPAIGSLTRQKRTDETWRQDAARAAIRDCVANISKRFETLSGNTQLSTSVSIAEDWSSVTVGHFKIEVNFGDTDDRCFIMGQCLAQINSLLDSRPPDKGRIPDGLFYDLLAVSDLTLECVRFESSYNADNYRFSAKTLDVNDPTIYILTSSKDKIRLSFDTERMRLKVDAAQLHAERTESIFNVEQLVSKLDQKHIYNIEKRVQSIILAMRERGYPVIDQPSIVQSIHSDPPLINIGTLTISSEIGTAVDKRRFISRILDKIDKDQLSPEHFKNIFAHPKETPVKIVGRQLKEENYKPIHKNKANHMYTDSYKIYPLTIKNMLSNLSTSNTV